ncbi:tRNA(Met) cytidine acetyltransferase [Pseudoalteromonas sp. BSi20652]|uniref:GNAT family N-acetyltransferase n=1 Tax=Pseudoalteromonas sp. BSi20652 TaxID=388384 RepID=UPI0002319625|nr:GNAT family N-acetyltransferase [Pseudoalteromonas sp. BSi20652]GAA58825.1 tRNA(Met) cytidine acetyltransferase [Pseudoalteromonas sp. BSi20652]
MHDYKLYKAHLSELEQQLADAYHRQLVLITGSSAWCYELLNSLIDENSTLVVSKQCALKNSYWPTRTHQILGQEFAHAVYDGFSGLHPDKLAALAGTVKAGGILFLLMPELNDLASWQDPALSTVQSYGQSIDYSLFNQRFATIIKPLPAFHFSEKNGCISNHASYVMHNKIDYLPQQNCVEQIVKVANGRANRPLLINADRGRGKSAALGLAAAKLTDKKIIICSTQFKATHSSFKHLAQELDLQYNAEYKQLANLQYVAPDALLNTLPECDLLLVDEAAAIPVPLLLEMLAHYPRIVFASTLVGYEGNGRGYTIRFSNYIKAHYKASKVITLDEPLRFAKHDPLEKHTRTLFALDAQYKELSSDQLKQPVHSEIAQQFLVNNEPLLQQLIALLALAHYQSSVNDLRQLLDAPSQRLFISQVNNQLVGVCLIAIEGGLSEGLAQQVINGERRPQGHLMAQTLSQLSFNNGCLTQLSARVVRIAIDPSSHNIGLGKKLLSYCESQVKKQCCWFGASFGATAQLLNFWQNQGFNTVKLGYQRDKSTAEHSALVVKCLNNKSAIIQPLKKQFKNDFFYALLTHFKTLDWQLVNIIIEGFSDELVSPDTRERLALLVNSNFTQFNISATLWQVVNQCPSCMSQLIESDKQLLIKLVLQNECNEKVIQHLGLLGKKQLENKFKHAVKNLTSTI